MINISDQHRCIFVHIPKVAGTSIKQTLELPGQGHPPWSWYASSYPLQWKQYLKFTVVRNPWDRVVSAYAYAIMKESYWHGKQCGLHPDFELLSANSFDECCRILRNERGRLKHESWYPQYSWITRTTGAGAECMMDMVLRYENLEKGFEGLCRQLKAPQLLLPHVNASGRGDYRRFYTDATRKMIAEVYAADIRLFGYQF